MKWVSIALLLVASVCAQDSDDNILPLAEVCDPESCVLPRCRCSTTDIPGGLNPRDVPQFVTVSFDDGVNVNNILTYRNTVFNRVNSNGCAAGTTFFVSHEYTNYQLVNELYNNGFEIALHSISHQNSQSYWAQASYDVMLKEFVDQKTQIAHFANIPYDSVQGIRLPFLQMSGNASFQMMASHGLKYDSSWPTVTQTDPGLWPYTLDYASTQDCIVPPCPTASIPGSWVAPMVSWTDLQGFPCSMVDACFASPDREDENAWYNFILTNFERHYFGNRAPFPFFVHEGFISAYPAVRRAFVRFLDLVNNLNDVFMVNQSEVIAWIEDPVPIPEYRNRACPRFITTNCVPSTCALRSEHNQVYYYMTVCNVCPRVYPWLGNPLGQ